MKRTALAAGAIWMLAGVGPGIAAASLPADAVRVEFKEPLGDRYVGVLNLVMGTTTLRRHSAQAYTFRQGDRGSQNDYALFFAQLPYVRKVEPLPRYSAADRPAPPVVIGLPGARATQAPAPRNTVPGQLLVRPKADADAAALNRLHASLGARVKAHIEGVDVLLLELPPGLTVAEAERRYEASGLVQYAEPNRVMGLPAPVPTGPAGLDGPGLFLNPDQLYGDHLLVRFRSDGPTPELVAMVYGARVLGLAEDRSHRISLPPQTPPLLAQRLFKLCPHVSQVEPAYGR